MHTHFSFLHISSPSPLSSLTTTLMALSRNHHLFLTLALAAVLLSFLTLLSGGIRAASSRDEEELRKKMVLGSRPPACVDRCSSCRPCEAILVIPQHKSVVERGNNYQELSHREDDSYYLLSWKCRCGNKFYQP